VSGVNLNGVKCSGHRVGVQYWAGVTERATFVSPRVAAVCTLEKDRYHLHIMWSTMQVLTAAKCVCVEFECGYLDVIPHRFQMGILEGYVLDAKSGDEDGWVVIKKKGH